MTDHPFRHEMMCRYYEPRCDLRGKSLKLVRRLNPQLRSPSPSWLLVHSSTGLAAEVHNHNSPGNHLPASTGETDAGLSGGGLRSSGFSLGTEVCVNLRKSVDSHCPLPGYRNPPCFRLASATVDYHDACGRETTLRAAFR